MAGGRLCPPRPASLSRVSRREARAPRVARVLCARTCACARARVAVARERSRGGEGGRSLSSPRPRTRVWLCRSRRTAAPFPLSLSSVHSRCLPHRTAAARGGCRLFPVRLFRSVPFRFWGVVRVPSPRVGGRRAPRVGVPPPSRRGSRARVPDGAGVARGGATGRVGAAAVLPPASSTPRPPSGYLATAFRRVGLKTPRGGRLSVPGVGGTEGPVGSRRRPAAPADSRSSRGGRPFPRRAAAVVGSGAPSRAPVGLASACPVRRCVVVRGPRVCRSRPALLVFLSLSRWPARGEPPLRSPAASPGAAGGEGDCAAVSSLPKGETLVRLLAVDHSARASMKNAASCEN